MNQVLEKTALDEFLARSNIESSPAWEWIDGRNIQKAMPTLFHSRLQRNLVNYLNQQTEEFEAIQELRCVIPPYSPVPDIVVVSCDRLTEGDRPLQGAPEWLIEIRSPDQSTLDLQHKILHCLRHGTQLAWLIDLSRHQIWVWQGDDLPCVYSGADRVPVYGIELRITVEEVMAMTTQKR